MYIVQSYARTCEAGEC